MSRSKRKKKGRNIENPNLPEQMHEDQPRRNPKQVQVDESEQSSELPSGESEQSSEQASEEEFPHNSEQSSENNTDTSKERDDTSVEAIQNSADTSGINAVRSSDPKIARKAKYLSYAITAGPITAQIWDAYLHRFDSDGELPGTIVFKIEERHHKRQKSFIALHESCLKMCVTGIGYDGNTDPFKAQNRMIITGKVVVDGQEPSELPQYADGTTFQDGTLVKVFYNLSARCGAIIKLGNQENSNEVYTPYVSNHLEYTSSSIF